MVFSRESLDTKIKRVLRIGRCLFIGHVHRAFRKTGLLPPLIGVGSTGKRYDNTLSAVSTLNGLLLRSLWNNLLTALQEVFARKWERKL